MQRILIPAATVAVFAIVTAGAAAAITCNGSFQVLSDGRQIATPYCEDSELARVAYCHGMCVTSREIRRHPSIKEEACKLVGDDIRVRDTCLPYLNGNGSQQTAP